MNTPRAFANPTVIPCRPGDPRLIAAGYAETAIGYEQERAGPLYLVVGHHAPDTALERGCRRFHLDPGQVRAALEVTCHV
ncbi:MAG: hypothetical protein KA204_04110 [Chromatiaceae bacterium]|nr:hypothetical protein [Chromatiaceae bacterium]MBP6582642.1 hypothetical protein [Chromatiaceae bacterium]MBP8197114.1 hypothetical protein [Chromatiaceae bacterium]MBP8282568.1 hypothetical protein [Chromatiaceae bacterium]MBP9603933.1 hypothetical protein [Chromatiaceae bacterium]